MLQQVISLRGNVAAPTKVRTRLREPRIHTYIKTGEIHFQTQGCKTAFIMNHNEPVRRRISASSAAVCFTEEAMLCMAELVNTKLFTTGFSINVGNTQFPLLL